MLLGIKDDEQDSLLSFLIEDTVNMIMAYCHIDVLPRQLERSVTYAETDNDKIFSNYYKRLDPFRKRKGRVPSDISIQ